jgi:signal transduction histidine kinase
VQAALATYRPEKAGRLLKLEDFEDLRLLLGPELRRRRQQLNWHVEEGRSGLPDLPGAPVRQALLNLLLNASAASGEDGRLGLSIERRPDGAVVVVVSDSGPGLPADALSILTGEDASLASGSGRGLGLWMVRRITDELGCRLMVRPSRWGGAAIELVLGGPSRQVESHATREQHWSH